jgi:hypothetical protein
VIWRVFQFQVPFHLPSLADIPQIAPHDDHHLLGSASSSNHAALLQPKSHRTVQKRTCKDRIGVEAEFRRTESHFLLGLEVMPFMPSLTAAR